MSAITVSDRPVAIVTGAARGIGRGCALALAAAGFDILVNDRTGDDDRALLDTLGTELAALGADSLAFPADVSRLDEHQPMVDAAVDRWGRIDCLINNAGVTVLRRGDLLEALPDSFDYCIDVNTRAVFFLSQVVARQMIRQGEIRGQYRSIINITSCNVTVVSPLRGEYCLSKAASSMVTRLFALRLVDEGIGVYEIRPGMIETTMTKPVMERYSGMIENGFVPMKRWGQPKDIATTAVTMAEGRIPYTVGQPVISDGGLTIVTF